MVVVVGGRRGERSGGDPRSSQISGLEKPDRRFCTAKGGEGRTEPPPPLRCRDSSPPPWRRWTRRWTRGPPGQHIAPSEPPFPGPCGEDPHHLQPPARHRRTQKAWGGGGHRASSSGSGAQPPPPPAPGPSPPSRTRDPALPPPPGPPAPRPAPPHAGAAPPCRERGSPPSRVTWRGAGGVEGDPRPWPAPPGAWPALCRAPGWQKTPDPP